MPELKFNSPENSPEQKRKQLIAQRAALDAESFLKNLTPFLENERISPFAGYIDKQGRERVMPNLQVEAVTNNHQKGAEAKRLMDKALKDLGLTEKEIGDYLIAFHNRINRGYPEEIM